MPTRRNISPSQSPVADPSTTVRTHSFIPFGTPSMAENFMHAVLYDAYGGGAAALKHCQVRVPSPEKDEVVVKLEAASINPFDWKVQKGMLRPFLPRKFPFIPGTDVAGEVVAVGVGVKKFRAGDKVLAMVNPFNGGGLAEFSAVKESITAHRPPEVSASEAAGLPVAGLTAHQALTHLEEVPGQQPNILVTAASGGVGHYAVQLAKLQNAHVTATCGTRNMELVRNLGADEVLDYTTPDGAALNSPSRRKYDVVVHCATGIPWSRFEANLSPTGKVIDITPGIGTLVTYGLQKVTFSKKKLVPLLLNPKGKDLEDLVKLMKEGKVKTVVDSKHALSEAEGAWARSIEGHATGKIIVEP